MVEMAAPPNLSESCRAPRLSCRAAAGFARPVRWAGVALAVIGAALLIVDRRFTPLPGWLPWTVVGCAFALMAAGDRSAHALSFAADARRGGEVLQTSVTPPALCRGSTMRRWESV
ncbi:MAG: hypothetical protein WDN44_13790 [Sphingomonas sp.]